MKLGLLLSGGKDSLYAGFLAKKQGYELTCAITMNSVNKESFMFHTPSIDQTKLQAQVMNLPLIVQQTTGEKEEELKDLEKAIKKAVKVHKIEGVITGAILSVYQASRIQRICNKLKLECFNPLWQKNQEEYLHELVSSKFIVILTGVFAYPLNEFWLGRQINNNFINELRSLNKRFKINLAGEGGEYETLVLNCPLFKRELKIKNKNIKGQGNSWAMEVELI